MSGSFSKLKTAILFAAYGTRASYYDDWLDAICQADGFDVSSFNIAQTEGSKGFRRVVGDFDLIVLLHSVNADNLIYAEKVLSALQRRKGILLSFVGNELSLPGAPMKPKIDFIRSAGVDIVATQLLQEAGDYLYADTGAQVVTLPHALNPNAFKPDTDIVARPVDIGIRSFRYPATYLGDNDRNRLIDLFKKNKFSVPLVTDISTERRLDRRGWNDFLNSCKGTVANEAGGNWLDRDDETMLAIREWLKARQSAKGVMISTDSPLRRLAHKLPWGVRQWLIKVLQKGVVRYEGLLGGDVDFNEVYERFFKGREFPPAISGKCVSSRHFDAAGTKVCQIMIEGRFNDIFKAGEHYIPLKRDLSDVEEALSKFCDPDYRRNMVERTYDFVIASHTYAQRVSKLEAIVRSFAC